MKLLLTVRGSPPSVVNIDDDEGTTTVLSGPNPSLLAAVQDANEAIGGPPLWAGPLYSIRRWAQENDVDLDDSDAPELPSEPDRVY